MPNKRTKEEMIEQTKITPEEISQAVSDISVAYLLNSLANAYTESCSEILRKRGMNIGRIKFVQNNLFSAFNRYQTEMKQMITKSEETNMIEGYDELQALVRNYLDDDPGNWNWQLRYLMLKKLYIDVKKENERLKNGNL